MLLSLLLISLGHALPQKLSQQGRVLDANGNVVVGTQAISFRIYASDTGGTPLWEEVLVEDLVEGYFSVISGANSLNPIDEELLLADPLYVEIEIGSGGPLTPRKELSAAPYARVAEVSQKLDGGSVNATEVQINGSVVIDSSGSWVGPTISLNWQNIQNIPSDFLDGDQDSLAAINCSQGEILGWNNGWVCTSDSSSRTVDADCVGSMLGFGSSNYAWSSWETTGWETSCNRSGYRNLIQNVHNRAVYLYDNLKGSTNVMFLFNNE